MSQSQQTPQRYFERAQTNRRLNKCREATIALARRSEEIKKIQAELVKRRSKNFRALATDFRFIG